MLSPTLSLILRAVLLSLSFFGLSATARSALKLNRFIAPFFTACTIIIVMMLSGMLGGLQAGFYLLYLGGFAGLIYTYIIRRVKPDFALIGLFILWTVYLTWRLWTCTIVRNDDVSHWALVARYLLEHDAFPDRTAAIVSFQSYPLGSASFIYYVSNGIASTEGLWLIAQNFLMGLLFLPVLSLVRSHRRWLMPAAGALFVYLFKYTRLLVNLQVDWLLPFFGIGAAAAVMYYRTDLKKALLAGMPAAIAVVYLKNSGMFFALITVLMLGYAARKSGCKRGTAVKVILLGTLAFIGAYLLWTLHVRLSYEASMDTKHAISLSNYAAEAAGKGWGYTLTIARMMLQELLHPYFYQFFAVAALAAGFAAVGVSGHANAISSGRRRELHRLLLGCGMTYVLWYVMLFAMYIFSMPTGEALRLASYDRYNATGMMYMLGLTCVALLSHYGSPDYRPGRLFKGLYLGVIAACLMAVCFADLSHTNYYEELLTRTDEPEPIRTRIQRAQEEYDLPLGGTYLVFAVDGADERNIYHSSYYVKYELYTPDLYLVTHPLDQPQSDTYGYGTIQENTVGDDPLGYIREYIDLCDAFLIVDQDAHFEALMEQFLAGYEGDTPIIYTYR